METTLLCVANIDAIFLMMSSVRWTLVLFECHCGYDCLRPELSKLVVSLPSVRCVQERACNTKTAPVLTARRPMQIYNHLEAVVPCPSDCLLEVRQLTSDVRLSWSDLERPIANGNADMIQSRRGTISVNNYDEHKRDHVRRTQQRQWQRSQPP